jgi:ATP phosphoribosyltransferase regulatory subunit
MSYYDGIIFRGYIDGVARGVLSGGRYDKLLDKMGKHTGAIGFAIYMNTLDLYFEDKNEYDVDILITYDDTADLAALTRTVKMLTGGGRSVRVQKTGDGMLKCREHFRYGERGLEIETA